MRVRSMLPHCAILALPLLALGCKATTSTSTSGSIAASSISTASAAPASVSTTAGHDSISRSRFDRPGFATFIDDGRLWVFRDGSDDHREFLATGEPAKIVTRIGVGPNRMTVRSVDAATIDAYLAAVPD